ncbi:MAG: YraN family protein [Burkholderiales bacterium]|nr:YraN family protein [Burkholderiales bacterium]
MRARSPGRAAAGRAAEALAARFLEARGLAIVARNYRCRRGEIDIVARDGTTLVFVEVRLRSDARHGGAADSIDAHKRARVLAAARHYLARAPDADAPCRCDVVLLDRLDAARIEWIRDAFSE